jgi:hypothetical protein
MNTIPFLLVAGMIYVVVAAVIIMPVVAYTRTQVNRRYRDLLILLIPFGVWMAFMISDFSTGSKSLSNLVVEPAVLAIGLAIAVLARVAIAKSLSEKMAFVGTLVGMCLFATAVYWITPALPE